MQAAIGGLALDYAREKNDKTLISQGEIILTLAVLAIIITAPIGSAAITLSGPLLLTRTGYERQDADNENASTSTKM